ncbi:hypothetical protein MTO96_031435 [Rhipicephalus appendiculatus]
MSRATVRRGVPPTRLGKTPWSPASAQPRQPDSPLPTRTAQMATPAPLPDLFLVSGEGALVLDMAGPLENTPASFANARNGKFVKYEPVRATSPGLSIWSSATQEKPERTDLKGAAKRTTLGPTRREE